MRTPFRKTIYGCCDNTLRRLARDSRGASSVEYIIILSLVVVGAIALFQEFGSTVHGAMRTANKQAETLRQN